MDVVVDNKVVVELKYVNKTTPVHEAQLLTYLESVHKVRFCHCPA